MAEVEVRTIRGSAQIIADLVKITDGLTVLHIHDDDLVRVKAETLDEVRAALSSRPEVVNIMSHGQAQRIRRRYRRERIIPTNQTPPQERPR
ncbi:hypothetical protein A3D80_02045 [Candidatus Roizmanbacteria bacterium RIFCSPHIGHO2_02_FULL_40_13b]|uniref:Uncharacterized protein n=1 Tax=Candidatus Roizmanbacteria bacterium RIFCSPHIGHO2_01_FULL_39_24 TaxID=1802032 RepID=A0A1F7GL35_9BACT|nr:MAG: hypothetical protein A2799_01405 [Candidatus Roizmanbacteria bacterium RIFCSPHIGHO2_01_FULL_39_24]OGK26907.1 MAG: hypothetical protein A3D80_02045 [Candidatus Roizmanbacteria bacterium RIFCSPHIGHO2_02_FULL_40_13b]OGK49459.1 MAG: hypothetical protein A3A56_03590 [Candidatus Roizmanbacteria bacterium RIFCSPLOWO2_01_FULL_40_32]OGK56251.1 MAG: hypothetical protein A3H83_02155 [Candidatus Roizmanbacteria bacterium RIFCSPLOWO2_02_FULL_39_8]